MAAILGVPQDSPLYQAFKSNSLKMSEISDARTFFRQNLLPSVSFLLENFEPYKKYIHSLRQAEIHWEQESDIYRHSLSKLRFGSHRGGESLSSEIKKAYDTVVHELIELKDCIPSLLQLDIGMRGVVYSFGVLKSWHDAWEDDQDTSWLEYSEWFTRHLNNVYQQGWFDKKGYPHRLHVTNSPADLIVNHKIADSKNALGALVCILVCRSAYSAQESVNSDEQWNEVWENFAKIYLVRSLRAGYTRQHKATISEDHPDWSAKKMNEKAKDQANKSSHAHLERLRSALDKMLAP